MVTKAKLAYTTIDTSNITNPKLKTAWEKYAKARPPVMAKVKSEIETLKPLEMAIENALVPLLREAKMLGQGQEVRLGFNFGRLAVAIVDANSDATGKPKKAISL